jgi:hypothetical protein
MTTTLSRTVIRPVRGADPVLGATVNATGLSPARGMLLVTVIHGTSETAVQMQRSCVAPPQTMGSLCCTTSNELAPPAGVKVNALWLTA